MAHFTVTLDEAIAAVRSVYGLQQSVEVQIGTLHPTLDADEYGWHQVPPTWKKYYAPDMALAFGQIEVIHRDGDIQVGEATSWNNVWSQDDFARDIVRYRKAP